MNKNCSNVLSSLQHANAYQQQQLLIKEHLQILQHTIYEKEENSFKEEKEEKNMAKYQRTELTRNSESYFNKDRSSQAVIVNPDIHTNPMIVSKTYEHVKDFANTQNNQVRQLGYLSWDQNINQQKIHSNFSVQLYSQPSQEFYKRNVDSQAPKNNHTECYLQSQQVSLNQFQGLVRKQSCEKVVPRGTIDQRKTGEQKAISKGCISFNFVNKLEKLLQMTLKYGVISTISCWKAIAEIWDEIFVNFEVYRYHLEPLLQQAACTLYITFINNQQCYGYLFRPILVLCSKIMKALGKQKIDYYLQTNTNTLQSKQKLIGQLKRQFDLENKVFLHPVDQTVIKSLNCLREAFSTNSATQYHIQYSLKMICETCSDETQKELLVQSYLQPVQKIRHNSLNEAPSLHSITFIVQQKNQDEKQVMQKIAQYLIEKCLSCCSFFFKDQILSQYWGSSAHLPTSCFDSVSGFQGEIEELLEVVCGLLNSGGGLIFFNLKKRCNRLIVEGQLLTKAMQTDILRFIELAIAKIGQGLCPGEVRIDFVKIKELFAIKTEQNKFLMGRYLTRIRVCPKSSQKLYFIRDVQSVKCFIFQFYKPVELSSRQTLQLLKRNFQKANQEVKNSKQILLVHGSSYFDHKCSQQQMLTSNKASLATARKTVRELMQLQRIQRYGFWDESELNDLNEQDGDFEQDKQDKQGEEFEQGEQDKQDEQNEQGQQGDSQIEEEDEQFET